MLTLMMSALLTLATSHSAVLSAPAPQLDRKPVEVRFVRDDSRNGRARVEIQLHRSDINEVVVEAFDEDGAILGAYTLHPWENGTFRAVMNVQFGGTVDARVRAASVTGFTIRSTMPKVEQFKLLLDEAERVTGCTGQCSPTRLECNNDCFLAGCTSATYSCQDNGNGCEATCTCLGCV